MEDFLLDDNGDLAFDATGDIALDSEPIKLDIKDIIRLNKGNEYHAPHIGVGITKILNNTRPQARTSIKQDIRDNMTADGIKEIELEVIANQDSIQYYADGKRY
jgi:hypothetical protein